MAVLCCLAVKVDEIECKRIISCLNSVEHKTIAVAWQIYKTYDDGTVVAYLHHILQLIKMLIVLPI